MTYENDLQDIILDFNNARCKPLYVTTNDNLVLTGVPVPFASRFRDYSVILGLIYTKLVMINYRIPTFQLDVALRKFLQLRDEIYRLCEKNNIKFVNVIF
jgi:hypothetical protein